MAVQRGGQTTGLISGATLGAVLGTIFPPLIGPAVGMLVGVSLLDLRDARAGASSGLLMGVLAGLGLGLHTLLSPGTVLPGMEACANILLCSLVLYSVLGAGIGLVGGWLCRILQRSGMFW